MKISIDPTDNLPPGNYELMSAEKLENAHGNVGYGRSTREVLLEYDRIGGRVVKDGNILPPQSLWILEQTYMNKPIEQLSKDELYVIIRRAENTDVPGSLYQRASKELEIRNQNELLESSKQKKAWYEKPVGLIGLGIIISLIGAYLTFCFGWN